MTPEATIGLLHLLDHWHLMLRALAGEPLPALPAHPLERVLVHRLPPVPDGDADEFADAWDALHGGRESPVRGHAIGKPCLPNRVAAKPENAPRFPRARG